ncbi:MAG: universal stress protein [Gammaproteobacteria bacterium]|nr:universal stress protein [Gammaproteobacteria bacterium]
MVVIGKRGRGHDLSDEAAGPTTETLIHEALRPVLVVPAQANTSGPILIAFDGSKGVQRAVVPGVQLAAALGAPVTVLTLAESQDAGDEIQAPLKQYLASYGVKGDFRVQVGRDTGRNAAKIVMDTASELNAGMILMGAFSVSPLKEFFVGSVTREVLTHAHCPVLMMT